jgi:16S rRNA (adenine1518-N6/adenine1519-N6)-dimethyltransferase
MSRARKRFGQHFLHDPLVIERILAAIDPKPGEAIVEIGPGEGAITAGLLARAGRLEAIELDRELVPRLAARFQGAGLVLHEGDALAVDYTALAAGRRLRLVGNLPYNVSTPLLFHLLAHSAVIADMHFMLQREVVERMAAAPGGKEYGRLTVMLAAKCRTAKLFEVGPGAFRPPPRVHSAIVRVVPHADAPFALKDSARFADLVARAFQMRRKTLRNALRGAVDEAGFAHAGIDPGRRAETLSPADFARLAATPAPAPAL